MIKIVAAWLLTGTFEMIFMFRFLFCKTFFRPIINTKAPELTGAFVLLLGSILIPILVIAFSVVVATATAAVIAAGWTIFFWLSFHYFNGAAFNCSII